MIQTIGMLEFNSIAKGIETCDVMLKAAEVSLIRTSTVCPGKYIIIISGDTGSVKASILAGEMNGGNCVVDKMIIQNVHPQLIPALSGTAQVIKGDAIGAMEFYSITSAIKAADVAAKAAQISLVSITMGYAVGGKGIVTLTVGRLHHNQLIFDVTDMIHEGCAEIECVEAGSDVPHVVLTNAQAFKYHTCPAV